MSLTAEVGCPNCGRKTEIVVSEMVPGRSRECTHCGAKVIFSGDDGRKVQKAMEDLKKTLAQGINIRL